MCKLSFKGNMISLCGRVVALSLMHGDILHQYSDDWWHENDDGIFVVGKENYVTMMDGRGRRLPHSNPTFSDLSTLNFSHWLKKNIYYNHNKENKVCNKISNHSDK